MDKTHKFFCVNENENANGVITCDGFVVRKGSLISSGVTNDCSEYVVKKRKQCKYLINGSTLLQEDVLFGSPTGTSDFVCGTNTDGTVEWKKKDGDCGSI